MKASHPVFSIYRRLKNRYGDLGWWPADSPFEVIVGAVLTQNTAWTNVEKALLSLKKLGPLTPGRLQAMPLRTLAQAIRPAGFFNVKARRLKNFLTFLEKEYGGDLQKMLREPLETLRPKLLSVNGIGPETADSILLYAAEKPSFVVDAYTKRIFSRYGLLAASAPYDEVRAYFTARLPKSVQLYNEYHALIVEHAKNACRTRPLCKGCLLSPRCAYAKALS